MADRMRLRDRCAVITGAGNGIGAALAHRLAERGCHLALADIRPHDLEATRMSIRERLGDASPPVSLHTLDVADRDSVAALPEAVAERHSRVDLLINNAGVALGGTFEQSSEADFDWLMEINLLGLVRMTRAFLPLLHESDDARLVNISSLFGLIAPPGQTAYSAAKFGVRGFSNALAEELKRSTVGVTVVHPGGIRTGIAQRARAPQGASNAQVEREQKRFERLLRMPPARAAEIIVDAIERRKRRVLVGSDAKVLALVERLMPVGYPAIVERLAR
ncbi:SDR family NAD(P)-dependent oxidoreductase [Acetobacteraceae bacterium KSS8]|uniref:SDR family NAD(P)-dependent oxidoreductase n=1 Tax=Endosaccharibacter trunci TaxID=2812733 RepID=A0ABT1W8X3_9PROT|nr:SDR family NAD(P)-dependent oxidoreductase [Acetobacteraceae bacterium KSS8]